MQGRLFPSTETYPHPGNTLELDDGRLGLIDYTGKHRRLSRTQDLCHSQRTSTHAPRFPFHVRTVPSIQTSQQQSLPDLQSVYLDHLYCPWMMNNCVGAGNLKYFLFILDVYVGVRGVALFGWNYFLCADEDLYLSSLHFAFAA
jgi:hypothetical protein